MGVRVPRRLGLQSLNLGTSVLPGVGWATGSGSAPGRGESQGEVRTGDAIGAKHMGGESSCGLGGTTGCEGGQTENWSPETEP